MKPKRLFEIIYAPTVKGHLEAIDRRFHSLIREAVETQLGHQPDVETRNRKPLKRPIVPGATWEIRFGPNNRFRVFYQVDQYGGQVFILAIAEKRRARVVIGEEEIEL